MAFVVGAVVAALPLDHGDVRMIVKDALNMVEIGRAMPVTERLEAFAQLPVIIVHKHTIDLSIKARNIVHASAV